MQNKKRSNKSIWKDSRFYFITLISIFMIMLIVQLFLVPILPLKFVIPIIIIIIILWGVLWFLLYSNKVNKFNRALGKIIIVVMVIALAVANFYIYKGGQTLNAISGTDIKTEAISVIVLKDNKAEKIEDLKDAKYGINEKTDRENTDKAIKDINTKLSTNINTSVFTDSNKMAQNLLDGVIDAIILNEAYRGLFEDKYPNFSSQTKVVYQYEIETKVNDISKNVNITKQPFSVYISGIDTYGSVNVVSRTDVNMIATVNPVTHQILLTSIPRDFYVPQTCQANQEDKLTHTGIFGVDCSVSTLENFFKIDLNYYARVNFSSLMNIIDALGGVTVDNPRAFSDDTGYHFDQGTITLNGESALAFSRDRHNQPEGDRDRGKNQMRVITGIIKKATSPSIITNYNSVMNAVSGSFETNMSSSDISAFVQKQLESMDGWNIVQYSVNGTGSDNTWSPANGFNSYVMIPDMTTVDQARSLMDKVKNGETIQTVE